LDADEGVVLVAIASVNSEKTLYSQSWYLVAGLKPRLRSHIQIQRQVFRNKEWYLLQDHSSGRFHRISPEAYFITGLMDGERTMAEIWDAASEHLGHNLPTQEEIIGLLSQIHRFDGLQSDLLPDMSELSERKTREKRNKLLSYLASPTALRFPLLDPDRFLESTLVLVRPLFSWFGLMFWMLVVGYGLLLTTVHWRELTSNVTERVLSLENVLILSLVYPVVKALHEFGHAYAVKRWGGEVHEMGIMLLVFMPIPYVDATSSYSFRDKKKRMVVGAAGIMVELFLAAIAVVVWVNADPGTVRTIAYNTMIIGGVSTLLMNGNPLIRYDAYYILSDYLEIPNLAARSNEYLGYFVKRRLLGIPELASTAQTTGEAIWLSIYGVASFVYRIVITTAITMFIAGKFFVFGILVAIWTACGFVIIPIRKFIQHMLTDPLMQRYRLRTVLACSVTVSIFLVSVAVVELPFFTVVEGIVWVPVESQVNAGADGFVIRLLAEPDSRVVRGEPLILCDAQKLDKEVKLLKGNLREVEARYQLSRVNDRVAAEMLRNEIIKARTELDRARERVSGLLIRSPADGIFVLPLADDLPGRFVKKGAPLGYVVDFDHSVLRIIVSQDDIELVRNRTRRLEARLAGDRARTLPARIVREVPAASNELPSMALSVNGGGTIALDPNENKRPRSFKKNFQFDVELTGTKLTRVGERVFVRFEHFPETLLMKWYRNIRQVLIKRFNS
jgi:putative peptide zinc metalloprotease protein